MLFAESTRWTMNWSVHQYQTPTTGRPKRMPVHGKFGSDAGFQRLMRSGPASVHIAPQPPRARRPNTVMVSEPATMTKTCRKSVKRTARSPPRTV